MAKYAEKTTVPIDRSKIEIEQTLKRYGATGFMYGWSADICVIAFEMSNRRIKIQLPMPDPNGFTKTPTGKRRTTVQAQNAHAQATKQRWRALALFIKAKLEAVESGITTFEAEFLDGTMLPSGQTVGEWLKPQIETVYDGGQMPPLLSG